MAPILNISPQELWVHLCDWNELTFFGGGGKSSGYPNLILVKQCSQVHFFYLNSFLGNPADWPAASTHPGFESFSSFQEEKTLRVLTRVWMILSLAFLPWAVIKNMQRQRHPERTVPRKQGCKKKEFTFSVFLHLMPKTTICVFSLENADLYLITEISKASMFCNMSWNTTLLVQPSCYLLKLLAPSWSWQ